LNGEDITHHLHDDFVSENAAQVSAIVPIRHLVNDLMRETTKSLSIVCEGRDMTTVVFPNAEVKIYLDASVEVRAKRRFDQGVSDMTYEQIKESIAKRDEIDKNKKEGALKVAPDALYIDTSDLTIDNVCDIILRQINK
jgi:cytidylate kinase/small subunit ribosomal protein S1